MDGPMVEVDDLVRERPGVLNGQPRGFEARGTAERVGVAEAAVHRPRVGDQAHAEMIGTRDRDHHGPPVGAEVPAIRPVGDTLSSTR